GGPLPLRVMKRFAFVKDTNKINITYEISSSDPRGVKVKFGVENNFNFQAGHAEDRFILVDNRRPENYYLDSYGSYQQVHSLAMVDQYLNLAVALESEGPVAIWHLPIYTVSLSESGFEKVYQGTTIVYVMEVPLSQAPYVIKLVLQAGKPEDVLFGNPLLTASSSR
ncbi:MAG: DUF1926 domain-containing protein, partial [candidate division Zixibacteria bacterium]|nr:DUF1926 domain-containing protein [candidate division Zixibacteria bacterium]